MTSGSPDPTPAAAQSLELQPLRIAYADPPYPGCAHLYEGHPDYAGEVDHGLLVGELRNFDGWCFHTSSVALSYVLEIVRDYQIEDTRVMAWVKPFAAFKRNVSVAYAWEPVLVKAARKPVVKKNMGFTYRDWRAIKTEDCTPEELDFIAESITLKKGLTGVKPEKVCHWLFEMMGCEPQDELHDLFPGTGAVSRAWETWRKQLSLLSEEVA